jgi:hypothetical protein
VPVARVVRVLAWTVPIGILIQAVLAGQAWFVSPTLFGLHGGIGHGVLLLAVVTTGLVWLAGVGRTAVLLASAVVLGLVGQTGLGYAGHRTGIAAASSVHVPLGVTLFGLSLAVAVLLAVQNTTPHAANLRAAASR